MNKTAVITGAGSGVGRAIALKLADQGWRVAIVGRRAEALQETIQLAGSHASRITHHVCDVGDAAASRRNSNCLTRTNDALQLQ